MLIDKTKLADGFQPFELLLGPGYMRYVILFSFLMVSVLGCRKDTLDPATCQVQNPLTDLPWLKAIADNKNNFSLEIEQGTYRKQTIYVVSTCVSCFAGGIATIYRCDGTEICRFGTYALEPNPSCRKIVQEEMTDRKVLLAR